MPRKIVVFASCVLLLPFLGVIAFGQADGAGPAMEARIDALVTIPSDRPGAVVAIFHEGRTVFAKAYGLADLTHRIPFETDTRTNLGSTSKQFTAFALALLAAEKKLSLDDDVRKFLPELPDFGAPVTLRHLLTHTSGYREIYYTLQLSGRRPFEDHISREEMIRVVQRQPTLQNPPGREWNYNNTGYALLSLVVERVTGTPFPAWMRDHVFRPLGMNDTEVRAEPGQIVRHSARGYTPTRDGYRETRDLDAAMGASAVYTTVGDLAKWMENFRSGGVGGKQLFAQMTTPVSPTGVGQRMYGLGLYLDEWKGLRRVFHHGDDVSHRSAFLYFPDLATGVVVESNDASFNAVDVANRIAEAYLATAIRAQPAQATPAFAPEQFDRVAGRYELEDSPGFVFIFRREGNQLWVEAAGEKNQLAVISATSFGVVGQEARVEFHEETSGAILGATIFNRGSHRARRLPDDASAPATATTRDLAPYAGRYYSEELETVYTLTVKGNTLTLHHPLFAQPIALRPMAGERFTGSSPTNSLTFQRDPRDRVSSFHVGDGSAREYVIFSKIP